MRAYELAGVSKCSCAEAKSLFLQLLCLLAVCLLSDSIFSVLVCRPAYVCVRFLTVFIHVAQDDRLRTPLLKLKLAVCSVMPEQIARYNMDCIAKVAK